jgi:hypothetical protein
MGTKGKSKFAVSTLSLKKLSPEKKQQLGGSCGYFILTE